MSALTLNFQSVPEFREALNGKCVMGLTKVDGSSVTFYSAEGFYAGIDNQRRFGVMFSLYSES